MRDLARNSKEADRQVQSIVRYKRKDMMQGLKQVQETFNPSITPRAIKRVK